MKDKSVALTVSLPKMASDRSCLEADLCALKETGAGIIWVRYRHQIQSNYQKTSNVGCCYHWLSNWLLVFTQQQKVL